MSHTPDSRRSLRDRFQNWATVYGEDLIILIVFFTITLPALYFISF